MNEVARKVPIHQAIYERISQAILFGELVPGQAVTIQGLADMIGSGMMPVRDAIRRLTSDGALRALGNRRIEVPKLSPSEVEQLTFARCEIEPKLAEMAVSGANTMLADQLKNIDLLLDRAIEEGSVENYLVYNYRFHFHLYEAADASILRSMARTLWLRSGPSLRVVCGKYGTANLPDMHDEAIAAVRAGNAGRLALAIKEDIRQGMDQITRALETE